VGELERYLAKVDRSGGPDSCWPWTGGCFESGYARFSLSDAKRRTVRAHRWGFMQLIGPLEPGEVVRHTCDNPPCQNPSHWLAGSCADNSADMVARGRSARGTRNAASRLTEAQVVIIKRDLLPLTAIGKGYTRRGQLRQGDIAAMYGVSQSTICAIGLGKVWSHVG
jgi:hypothetical protein